MFKKILIFALCLSTLLLSGCFEKTKELTIEGDDTSSVAEPEPVKYINPLTGLAVENDESLENRPVAIMVNNISVAQTVQTGLYAADIVYETEVEGGITRLMAVYQNIKPVEKIGTVRSARYAYIDLALGHNAIYVHHGADERYAGKHLAETDHFVLDSNNGGARIKNGLATEHTLYAYGDKLWECLEKSNRTIKNDKTGTWQNFADEDSPVKLENTASAVSVPFSTSYKTTFKYDAASGKYVRYFNGTERKDYYTKSSLYFKNIFVLSTSITYYSDNKHRNIALEGGDGYYFVNGTYTKIKWSKGADTNGIKFTDVNGKALTVNPGNSWVCIADSSRSQPIIEE